MRRRPAPAAEEEAILDRFLGEGTRADTWRELRRTLAGRLQALQAERDALPAQEARRAALERKIRELQEQVGVLAQEEAVSRFVEDSVRATLARPAEEGADDDDGGPY